MKTKPKGASSLEREVNKGYRAFMARRGLKTPGKWTTGYGKGRGLK